MIESIAQRVEAYFNLFPNLNYEQAHGLCPELTVENFRMIKSRMKKKQGQDDQNKNNNNKKNKKSKDSTSKNGKVNFHDQPNKIEKLTATSIEKLILDMLNRKSSIPESQIRIAVDFMVKVKKVPEGDDLLIDAKFLNLIGTDEGVEYEPGDMVKVGFDFEEFKKEAMKVYEGDGVTTETLKEEEDDNDNIVKLS